MMNLLDETHLDTLRGLILLKAFHCQYWLAAGRTFGCKNYFKYERFMLYQSKDNLSITQKPGQGNKPADYIRVINDNMLKYELPLLILFRTKGGGGEG